jgi:hypothetical protein
VIAKTLMVAHDAARSFISTQGGSSPSRTRQPHV